MRSVFFPESRRRAGAPLLVHIAALSSIYNRVDYAVECIVTKVEAGPVSLVYLNALTPDESQAGSSCIHLVLHGRWRRVCEPILRVDSYVRVERARVSEAMFAGAEGLHSFQLELVDSQSIKGSNPNMRIFGFSSPSCLVVASHGTLHQRMQVAGHFHENRGVAAFSRHRVAQNGALLPIGGPGVSGHRSLGESAGVEEPRRLDIPPPRERDISRTAGATPSVELENGNRGSSLMAVQSVARKSRYPRPVASVVPLSGQSGCTSPTRRSHNYVENIATLWNEADSGRAALNGKKINVYGVIIEARGPCITKGSDLRSEVVIADPSSPSPSSTGMGMRTLTLHRFEAMPQDAIPFRAVGDVVRAHRVEVNVFDDLSAGTRMIQAGGKFFSTYVLWAGDSESEEPLATVEPVRLGCSSTRPSYVEHTITEDDKYRVASLRLWGCAYLRASTAVDRPILKTVPEAISLSLRDGDSKPFDLVCSFEGHRGESSDVLFVVSGGYGEYSARNFLLARGLPVRRQEGGDPVEFGVFSPSWPLRPTKAPSWLLIRDVYCIRTEDGIPELQLLVGTKTSTMVWLRPESPEVRLAKARDAGVCLRSKTVDAMSSTRQAPGSGVSDLVPRPRPQMEPISATQIANTMAGSAPGQGLCVTSDEQALGDRLSLAQSAIVSCFGSVVSTHSNEDRPVTALAIVRQKALELGTGAPSFRIAGRVSAVKAPETLFHACRPVCPSCKSFVMEQAGEVVCVVCQLAFPSTEDRSLKWAFEVSLIMEDAQGSKMDIWISGEEACQFFRGAVASDLRATSNAGTRKELREHLDLLLCPDNIVDCSVIPFVYWTDSSVSTVGCKVFATTLLPQPQIGS